MRRLLVAGLVAGWALLAGPGLPGPLRSVAEAHSQLVSSSPGAGAVADASPAEIRLVFSEPIAPGFSAVDLIDRYGRPLVSNAGAPDPGDPRTLVVPVAVSLDDGVYTVDWHALSAADGHATSGFFTFGVGERVPPGTAASGTSIGGLHGGHDTSTAAFEVIARILGYLGLLLSFGLAVVGWAVLRPSARIAAGDARGSPDVRESASAERPAGRAAETSTTRAGDARRGRGSASAPAVNGPGVPRPAARATVPGWRGWLARLAGFLDASPVVVPRTAVRVQAVALLVAALGGLLLAAATAEGPGVDALRFLVSTRPGLLVAARVGVAVAGAVVAGLLLRRGRVGAAASVAGAAGGAGLVLMAFDGHAAAGPSASLVSMVVHLGAAATWLSGVLALAWIAAPRGAAGSVARGEYLRAAVPRFSALALVSVALVALTGLVQEWMLARSFVPLGTQYGAALVAKTLIFAVALIFGALNFLDGGRGRPSQADLRRRLLAEAALAIGVLVAAANLASGSPPASQAAAEIERAPSSAVATMPIDLQILPGRPGRNRLDVVLPPRADPLISIDLVLQRLDSSAGPARYELRRLAGSTLNSLSPGDHFVVDGGLLPPTAVGTPPRSCSRRTAAS